MKQRGNLPKAAQLSSGRLGYEPKRSGSTAHFLAPYTYTLEFVVVGIWGGGGVGWGLTIS